MPANTPRWSGTVFLTEQAESGSITVGERTTRKQVYEATLTNCRYSILPRGTFGSGSMLGWVVSNCQVDPLKGARGRLTITWEPGGTSGDSIYLPCDEFDLQPIELYPAIERNKIYNRTETGTGSMENITIDTILAVNRVVRAPNNIERLNAQKVIDATPGPNPVLQLANADQQTMAQSLLNKFRKGEETFYLSGFRYTVIHYSYELPTVTGGGFIQTAPGPFTWTNLAWLRLADTCVSVGVNGSMYKLTKTWIGGPPGHWDAELYPAT